MKQSAVEWFYKKVLNTSSEQDLISNINLWYEQAKEKENEKQEDFSIEFAEWCNDNYFRIADTSIWLQTIDFESPIKFTTQELLEIFKNK